MINMFKSLRNKLKDIIEQKEKLNERISQKKISESDIESAFSDIENVLLQNSVAIEVIDKINSNLKTSLGGKKISRSRFSKQLENEIRKSIEEIIAKPKINEFMEKVKSKKPFVMVFIGVNGAGKTTTIARMTKFLQREGLSCVIAAGDTFRAASIEQLEVHGENLGVKIIKQNYGADSAAVAFDAVKHAESKKIDVVLIDTAGRQHSNSNLMQELEKIGRVVKPDATFFVADSLTGNDAVIQAKEFRKAIDFDYNILTKTDVDEKGGAILSIAYVTGKPILFLGTGQKYGDFEVFNKKKVLDKIFSK